MEPIAPICPAIVDAWEACEIQGPYAEDACESVMSGHPAVADPADCTDAIRDRLDCYAMQDCATLESCSLWGCMGEDPCPDEAGAVDAACVRTPCEQHWDARLACELPVSVTQPGYCEYVKALDSLFVDDVEACHAAYDARVACFAAMTCDELAQCSPTSSNACVVDGEELCPAEQALYELHCEE